MTPISNALQAWAGEGPTDAHARWILSQVAELMIEPMHVMTGRQVPYDDRGLKLQEWLRNGPSSPWEGRWPSAIFDAARSCDPDEVFGAIKTHFPGILPADADREWRRPSPFFSM